jgi:hypothetical protein
MKGMKAMQKIKLALALAAVLAMSGNGWAKSGGLSADLNGDTVTLEVTVPTNTDAALCDSVNTTPGTAQTYAIKAYIFQPSGRMFGIALGYNTQPFSCDTTIDQQVPMELQVFPGLRLKSGPATFLFQVIQTTTTASSPTTPSTTTNEVIYEYGSRVDLH